MSFVLLLFALAILGRQSGANLDKYGLRDRCCRGAYLHVKAYNKSIFEQINIFLYASEIANRLNLTNIVPNILVSRHYEHHLDCGGNILNAQYNLKFFENSSLSTGCPVVLPFEQVFSLSDLQQGYPQQCLLSIEQAEVLCGLQLGTVSDAQHHQSHTWINNDTWHNPQALWNLRTSILNQSQGLLLLSGHSIYDEHSVESQTGPVFLSHKDFLAYRKSRYQLIKNLGPGKLIQTLLDDIWKQSVVAGEYIAVEIPHNLNNASELQRVVQYVKNYTLSEYRSVYLVTTLASKEDVAKVWRSAGFRVGQFGDLNMSINMPGLVDLLELFICARAKLFYGYGNSPFATHMYEYRYINTAKAVGSPVMLPSHDVNKPFTDCCRGGVGYDYILAANHGLIRLEKSLNIVMWGLQTDTPTGGAAHFFLALRRSFGRMGHNTYSMSRSGGVSEKVMSGAAIPDLHILNLYRQYSTGVLENVTKTFPGGLVVVRTDGPFYLHRNNIKHDYTQFNITKRYGHVVVFQSRWSFDTTTAAGLDDPISHMRHAFIGNGAEPSYFYPKTSYPREIDSDPSYRLKVCTSVYSDGDRKNFRLVSQLVKYQESHNFELVMAGRLPRYFTSMNATLMSEYELGNFLRRCDVFLAPSWYECFSNSEVQALACGLPVVGLNESSHPEVSQGGGVFFGSYEQRFNVTLALDAIAEVRRNYWSYVKNIPMHDINSLAEAYLDLMK